MSSTRQQGSEGDQYFWYLYYSMVAGSMNRQSPWQPQLQLPSWNSTTKTHTHTHAHSPGCT